MSTPLKTSQEHGCPGKRGSGAVARRKSRTVKLLHCATQVFSVAGAVRRSPLMSVV